ncbi:MAG: carbon-nitrogen hydrolase family protein [Pseudomonadales bacterium]|nr:carbon-nitrogen hydrolase family protein [Pseudomonadales bacterium]
MTMMTVKNRANSTPPTITAAAIQLDTRVGDTQHNLEACQRLAEQAVKQGAQWIALPEFFNTGVCFDPGLVAAIESEDGPSARFLREFSTRHAVVIGGSFMCRVARGGVRNRYVCFSNGERLGKHDKDLPTMWENAFYEAGDSDDNGELGRIGDVWVGTAVCWEFMRSQTARRLQGKVDVLIGGSHWWSLPNDWPTWLTRRMEAKNAENLLASVQLTAQLIGAPVIHASHCNRIQSRFPGIPWLTYHGILEGHTAIVDGHGQLLAHRSKDEGEGIITARITPGYVGSQLPVPQRFWLRPRGLLPTLSWHLDGFFGRRWYQKNVKDLS